MSIEQPEFHQRRPLAKWQVFVLAGTVTLICLGLAGFAAAASYESVSGAAAVHHVPLPRWTPISLDGGLFAVVLVNIVLTLGGMPMLWVRVIARLLAFGSIAANAAAGWPDPVGVGLRVASVALFVVLVEIGQAVLLRRRRNQGDSETIPVIRWALAPRSTLRLWRRMRLWEIRDYRAAIGMELSRLHAIEKLCMLYGAKTWRSKAPRDLVWMLSDGVHMEEALNRVAELIAAPPAPAVQASGGDGSSGSGQPPRPGSGPRRRRRRHGGSAAARRGGDVSTQAEAFTIIAAEPTITGKELGDRLGGLSESYGCRLIRLYQQSVAGPDQVAGSTEGNLQ